MTNRSIVGVMLLAGALALVGSVAEAQVIGTGTASGIDKVRVKGCGKSKAPAVLSFTLFTDGTWSAVDEDGHTFSGFHTAVSDKKFDLTFDASSETLFVGVLEDAVGTLCNQVVTVTSAVRRKFFLKRNKKRTKAKVRAKYTFTGTAGGESGRAKYILKATGPYAELQ